MLAHLLRTDRQAHRPIADDTLLADAIQLLARAHQDAIWHRQDVANRLRSTLREFFPAALTAFPDLSTRTALTVLGAAPTPAEAARLTRGGAHGVAARGRTWHPAGRRRPAD